MHNPPQTIHVPLRVVLSHSRYDPNRGYYWEFSDDKTQTQKDSHTSTLVHPEEPTEPQRRKVDCLLSDLLKKFPPKAFARKVQCIKDSLNASCNGGWFATTSPPLPGPPKCSLMHIYNWVYCM